MKFRLGLSAKISLLVVVPLVLCLFLSWQLISKRLADYRAAGRISDSLELIGKISSLEGARQKELLGTVSFLTDPSADFEFLDQRRRRADTLLKVTGQHAGLIPNKAEKIRELVGSGYDQFSQLREQLDQGTEFDSNILVDAYLETEGLLDLVFDESLRLAISQPSVYAYLRSLYDLETARRFTSLLHASLASRIGAGEPLSLDEVDRLNFFNGMLQAKLQTNNLSFTEEGTKSLNQLINSEAYASLPRAYYDVVGNYSTGTFFSDIVLLQNNADEIFKGMSSIISQEREILKTDVDTERKEAQSSFRMLALFLVLVTLFVVCFCYVTIRKLSRSISSSVEELMSTAQHVHSAANQLSASSQTMSSDALTSATSIEETVSHIEKLKNMVNENSAKAQEANKIAHENSVTARKGEGDIKALLTSMNDIIESSKQVEEITRVIDEIAFQTNLLSLNAAVEAARAGEHGKGFSVVADAVRSLAQRSAVAAKDIDSLVKSTLQKTQQGSLVASNGEKALQDILESSTGVADLVSEIARGSLQQSERIEAVSDATGKLDIVTQANARASQHTATASDALLSQSKFLNRVVAGLASLVDSRVARKFVKEKKPKKNTSRRNSSLGMSETQLIQIIGDGKAGIPTPAVAKKMPRIDSGEWSSSKIEEVAGFFEEEEVDKLTPESLLQDLPDELQ